MNSQSEDSVALQNIIEKGFAERETLTADPNTHKELRNAVEETLNLLDKGELRVAEPINNGQHNGQHNGRWKVNEWAKKAILLSFRLSDMRKIPGAPDNGAWWDKVKSKFSHWSTEDFQKAAFRSVPTCIVRHSAYIAPNVILMPSFVNLGAYVDSGTMIDTWATVGSCAQIGKNVHLSGGAGIGGVLEPLQAAPVIIEDNCFIGARAEVAEGVIIEKGSVLSMGVYIGASTRVVDRESGDIHYGRVPAGSVVVSGTLPGSKTATEGKANPSLYCAVIVKRVDEKTRAKTSINELLRF